MSIKLELAKQRIDNLKSEMGSIKNTWVTPTNDTIVVEFENGMNLQLSTNEVIYQALERLDEMKQHVIHN